MQLDCIIIEAFPEGLHLCVNIHHIKVTSWLLICQYLILGTRTLAYRPNAPQSITKRDMKYSFEAGKPQPHTFLPRQKVWLNLQDINIIQPSCKLSPCQLGLYEILEWTSDLTYCLCLPPFMHQHPVFQVDHLPLGRQ